MRQPLRVLPKMQTLLLSHPKQTPLAPLNLLTQKPLQMKKPEPKPSNLPTQKPSKTKQVPLVPLKV
jgi:hypothetical protein